MTADMQRFKELKNYTNWVSLSLLIIQFSFCLFQAKKRLIFTLERLHCICEKAVGKVSLGGPSA